MRVATTSSMEPARRAPSAPGAYVLDGYEALDVIGSGTFGLIRKVRRKSDGALFARKELKFERMTERDRRQIVSEVNILRTLHHENVVRYEERFVDAENGILYIVMELCEGGDLGAIIKRCRRSRCHLPEDTVWAYLSQMTAALDACHNREPAQSGSGARAAATAQSILHRDLKPENVFLDLDQNVKLGDFGLSKQIGAQAFANTYVGTPYYMSPELASGQQYDIKSDIWALGCIVFELCALSPPFDASDQAELTRKIKLGCVPALPRQYSRDLQDVVSAMLQLDPRRRPTTRQLLQVRQIKFACRTHELANLHRTLTKERERVQAFADALAERERAVAEREEACAASAGQLEAQLTEEVERAHVALAERDELLQAKDAEISRLQAMLQAPAVPKSPSCSAIPVRSRAAPHVELASPSPVTRVPMRSTPRAMGARRVSGGRARPRLSAEVAAEAAHTTFGSPYAQRARKLAVEPGADAWEDQEEPPAPVRAAPSTPVNPALARVRGLAHLETDRPEISDCTMKDASNMWADTADALAESEQQLTESVAQLQVGGEQCSAPGASEPHSTAPPGVALTTDEQAEQAQLPCTRTVPTSLNNLPEDPHWLQYEESERPSPFLKRVHRVPLDSLDGCPPPPLPTTHALKPDTNAASAEPPAARFTVGSVDQENAGPVRRSFGEQRRRRSSLLRSPGARPALTAGATRSEATRIPARRATMLSRSPSEKSGLRAAPSPSSQRARRERVTAALQS